MVDKNFEKITYEDNNGNVKGVFQTFIFESDGANAPYNEGYGQNLIVTRELGKEKIPNLGARQPLKIEQDDNGVDGDPVKIAFTTLQTRSDEYGMLFAIQFLNGTEKAIHSYSASTSDGSVDTQQSIKNLGFIAFNENVYEYYLVLVNSDVQSRTETTIQFNFFANQLTNDKMSMEIYEGFTFDNFSNADYTSANLTTHTPYPHQKDFDKHKFQDVMNGDVLLAGWKQNDDTVTANDELRLKDVNLPIDVMSGDAFLVGTKQNDGTVLANGNLRLTGLNLRGVIPFRMPVMLPYKGLSTSVWSVARNAIDTGYPSPVFPCHGTGRITIRLLTHYFDNDAPIPTSNFTLQYRLIAYKETGSDSLSRDFHLHTNVDYTNADGVRPVIKRTGDVFYLNRELTYDPPSDCIGYGLELKQIKPTSSLGNESLLVCLLTQVM